VPGERGYRLRSYSSLARFRIWKAHDFKVLLSPLRRKVVTFSPWVNAGRKDHKEHTSLIRLQRAFAFGHQVLFVLDGGSDKLNTIWQCWEYTLSSDRTASNR
jgi:hypothetical protein